MSRWVPLYYLVNFPGSDGPGWLVCNKRCNAIAIFALWLRIQWLFSIPRYRSWWSNGLTPARANHRKKDPKKTTRVPLMSLTCKACLKILALKNIRQMEGQLSDSLYNRTSWPRPDCCAHFQPYALTQWGLRREGVYGCKASILH